MSVIDYISSIFWTPSPSLSACSQESKDATSKAVVPANEEPIALGRADLNAVMASIDPKLNECSLKEKNPNLWLAVANYLVNSKYQALKIGDTVFGAAGNMSGVDLQVRDAVAGLNDNQRLELVKALAIALNAAHGADAVLFSNLSAADQSSYNTLCSSSEPSGLAYWTIVYSEPGYPKAVNLSGVTKQGLLKLIAEIKTKFPAANAGSMACSAESVVSCLSSGTIDAATRQQILTPYYPFSQICEMTPAGGKQGQELTITFNGSMTGILGENNALAQEFAIDFGAGITPTYGTPVTSNGVVTSLPVTVQIDSGAAAGSRSVLIKFGELLLQTLQNFSVTGVRKPQCADGLDNDRDGKIDGDDPDCSSATDNSEAARVIEPPVGEDACAGKTSVMLSGCCRNNPSAASCQ
ncbi:MAG: hypothetical protein WC529_04015 [Candidatus Margulisiibacteriota bacterium]